QSLGPLHCGSLGQVSPPYRSTPSPEVTGLVCLVPSREFSRAPVDLLLAHLCRFPVRSPVGLARGFSGKSGLSPFVPRRAPHRGSGSRPLAAPPWICLRQPPTHLDRDFQPPAVLSLLRPPIAQSPNPRNRTVHLLSLAY